MSEPLGADTFAERLLQIIDEGRRTVTYKLALLVALIDACAEQVDASGNAPSTLHTRVIAEHVVRIYFLQVRLYLADDGRQLELRQITNNQSAVINAVLRPRIGAESNGLRTIREIRRADPETYEHRLDRVEETFARYPLRLLQVLGTEHRPFLYARIVLAFPNRETYRTLSTRIADPLRSAGIELWLVGEGGDVRPSPERA